MILKVTVKMTMDDETAQRSFLMNAVLHNCFSEDGRIIVQMVKNAAIETVDPFGVCERYDEITWHYVGMLTP